MIKKRQKISREEINAQSKLLKRKKKHKGLPSGSRINHVKNVTNNEAKTVTDSRIGSKKPIPLIVETEQITQSPPKQESPQVKSKKLSPEQELTQLENNPYLEELLDLIENDEPLTTKQQCDLDEMLDRIDMLMEQLGYLDDDVNEKNLVVDENNDHEVREDIVSLLKQY